MRKLKEKLSAKLSKTGGFTLIEMLIVVAIIAILVAISIPLVNHALERARDATDQANERSAKAEAVLCFMGLAEDSSGAAITTTTGDFWYDAAKGALIPSAATGNKPGTGYGQCTGVHATGYTPTFMSTNGTAAKKGLVLKVNIAATTGVISMTWE